MIYFRCKFVVQLPMTEKEFKIQVLPLSKNVYPMARRMLLSDDLAYDAVQQCMMKLWENRRQLDRCSNIKAFVFKVVKNICLDEIKRKKPVVFDEPSDYLNLSPQHNDQHEKSEIVEIIQRIIDELPANQREAIQLRDIDGLDFVEIAEILDTDVAYARVLLSRARKSVKEKYEKIYAYEAIQRQ